MEKKNNLCIFDGIEINPKNLSLNDLFDVDAIRKRELYIFQEIDADTLDYVSSRIMKYNQEDVGKPIKERRPIIIYISSYGGSVLDGFGIVNTIEHSKTPVWTVNIGYCFSMAFHIFISGHKRFTYPDAVFLHHDGSDGSIDSSCKFRDYADFLKRHRDKVIKPHTLRHTKITEEDFDKNERVEWYIFADEAKELGITDYVIDKNGKYNSLTLRDI